MKSESVWRTFVELLPYKIRAFLLAATKKSKCSILLLNNPFNTKPEVSHNVKSNILQAR